MIGRYSDPIESLFFGESINTWAKELAQRAMASVERLGTTKENRSYQQARCCSRETEGGQSQAETIAVMNIGAHNSLRFMVLHACTI